MFRHPSTHRTLLLACFLFTLAPLTATGEAVSVARVASEREVPALHVLWHDAYGLFPAPAIDGMKLEVESLFSANGVRVELHPTKRGQAMSDYPRPSVNVILHPIEPRAWNLEKNVMAAAVGEPDEGFTVFVFFPAVLRTIGAFTVPKTPRGLASLSRAMGRVVAHEIVHVLAPERGHAPAGLMAERLTRKLLLRGELWLDGTSSRLVRVALSRRPRPTPRRRPERPPAPVDETVLRALR